MLDYLTHHLDEGYSIDIIYLDFQKAFDTVPHRRLLQKLTSFGIHVNVLKWIGSFLSNRVQQVVLNGHKSSTIPVISGVPQGSVLGPLLFTMFVNEIPSIVSSPVLLFADDTKIFRVIRNREDYTALQSDLDLLQKWSQQWLLNQIFPSANTFTSAQPTTMVLTVSTEYLLTSMQRTATSVLFLTISSNSTITPLKLLPKLTEYLV